MPKKTLDEIVQNYFGLDPRRFGVHSEVIFKEHDPDGFDSIKDLYLENLRTHPTREEVSKRLYVDDALIVHIYSWFSNEEVSEIKNESVFYYPLCTIDEILRIENPTSPADHLLKIRADAVADNPRLARIFFSRKEKYVGDWSITNYYGDCEFDDYVRRLSVEQAEKCEKVPAGFALLREPNGACIRTSLGKLIVVSESLRYFLFYMNVFLFGENFELPFEDRKCALFIGIRTMLQTEAPDFDLDPRGKLPDHVENTCWAYVRDQLKFVIGHEYAHLLLDHHDNKATTASAAEILSILEGGEQPVYFTPRQRQEFEADAGSILHADYDKDEQSRILNAATLFFIALDIFYVVSDYINPSYGRIKTHPDPIQRIWELRKRVLGNLPNESGNLYSDVDVKDWLTFTSSIKEILIEAVLPYNIEQFENYSSIYFPTFRGEIKHDRFDF